MKAALVSSYSTPPRYADFDDPTPGEGELLVTVTAAGLHPIVKALAAGKHYGSTGVFPFISGVDGVGKLDNGQRVFFGAARSPFGTMADLSLAGRNRYLVIPDSVDDVTAAAMMNPGMSSWAALAERAHFAPGESVLILGATGSAGQMAVQIAKRFGVRRIVSAGRDPEALEQTKSLGADATISLTQDLDSLIAAFREEIAGNKIDVILDYLWGEPAEAVLAAIAKKGLDHSSARIRYIQIGNSAGPNISLPAAILRSSGLEILGSGFGSVNMERLFASMADILQEAAKEPFKIAVTVVPLRDVESLWNSKSDARLVFQP
ncbi:MAG TPA: zinc-binding alcohol dehydrogenase family protein [Acidobacteriaceae bacterium]|nr:zinc-binding alcohol dehydrogenase family protein [Acidobacteriaceae bacterium]